MREKLIRRRLHSPTSFPPTSQARNCTSQAPHEVFKKKILVMDHHLKFLEYLQNYIEETCTVHGVYFKKHKCIKLTDAELTLEVAGVITSP